MSVKKLASLIIKINANGAQAQKELKTLEKKVDDLGKRMRRIGGNMTKYVTAPLVALGVLSVKAADAQLQAEAKLLNALKGRKDIQERLMRQASQIQSRSLFGDEVVVEQQAFLAALGLTEAQITATIEAAVQLSAALGIDLTSAVRNLAKTYSGMTGELGEIIPALRNLTAEELKAGEAIEYVNENYKGFAEAAADTGAGSLVQLKNKLGDLAEKIGTALLPILERLVPILEKIVDFFTNLPPAAQNGIVWIGLIVAAIGPLINTVGTLATSISTLGPMAAGAGKSIAAAFGAGGAAFVAVAALLAMIIEYNNMLNRLEGWTKDYEAQQAEELNVMTNLAYNDYVAKYTNEKNPFSLKQLKYLRDQEEKLATAMRKWVNNQDRTQEEGSLLYKHFYKGSNNAQAAADIRATLPEIEARLAGHNYAIEQIEKGNIIREWEVIETTVEHTVERTVGIIEGLKQQIASLEDRKLLATSEEEIRRINDELKILTEELERINNLKSPGEIVLDKIATSPINWGDVEMKGDFALEWGPLSQRNFEEWRKAQLERANRMVETVQEFNEVISRAVQNAAIGLGEMLGNLITGEEVKPLQSLLEFLGKLLKELGAALITYAGLIEAFKKTFSNPYVAIAVGIAAVAAGQVFINLAKKPMKKLAQGGLAYGPTMAVVGDNPGAKNDPEVIAPLSKLRDYMGGQKLELTGEIEWELRGDTLRAVLDRENLKLSRIG